MSFKSFYKKPEGNEAELCKYPTRLDTYGCGCQHDCKYCYAKSLLSFRNLWNPDAPEPADVRDIAKTVARITPGSFVRLGGMTDCFMPLEAEKRVTYKTIQFLNKRRVNYLIVTKSNLVASPEYLEILDPKLAHIQLTVTTLDDKVALTYERASIPSQRIKALRTLQDAGYDVAIRLSPIIPELMDFDLLNSLGIQKTVVEFLRVNSFIEKWFPQIDYAPYKLKQGGYRFMRLKDKKEIIEKIHIPEITVCEDYKPHFKYWQVNVNPNKDDCCNLRRET